MIYSDCDLNEIDAEDSTAKKKINIGFQHNEKKNRFRSMLNSPNGLLGADDSLDRDIVMNKSGDRLTEDNIAGENGGTSFGLFHANFSDE